ncbi:hypothetical protein GpartN1_g1929.t1 [Galdieria partita]|uniref:UBC core domain-containing protein n=1 Tax=Galdieria partita TaxID=83374 RepID=A0A9C7PSX8_9RHOD|nr:hypothetical protein GpartN1_g1929.t1 [Galdieria partita]
MAFISNKRLYNDLIELYTSDYPGVSFVGDFSNDCSCVSLKLRCDVDPSCPYFGFMLPLTMCFSNYPLACPSVRFDVDVFHPNVYENGLVCLNILSAKEWSPALSLRVVLLTLLQLLELPNDQDPARREAGESYIRGDWYERVVRILDSSKCERF